MKKTTKWQKTQIHRMSGYFSACSVSTTACDPWHWSYCDPLPFSQNPPISTISYANLRFQGKVLIPGQQFACTHEKPELKPVETLQTEAVCLLAWITTHKGMYITKGKLSSQDFLKLCKSDLVQ